MSFLLHFGTAGIARIVCSAGLNLFYNLKVGDSCPVKEGTRNKFKIGFVFVAEGACAAQGRTLDASGDSSENFGSAIIRGALWRNPPKCRIRNYTLDASGENLRKVGSALQL